MYLEVDLVVKEEEDIYEFDWKFIFDENKFFVIRDSVLDVV